MRFKSSSVSLSLRAVAFSVMLGPSLAAANPPGEQPAAPAAFTSGEAAVAAPADDLTLARTLYTRGVDYTAKRQWAEACEALGEAWRLKHHWQIAMMLGWAELEVGKVRAAIAHLTFASAAKETKDWEDTTRVDSLLLVAESRLAHVSIVGVPAGARVLVDGELVGTAPFSDPVAVDPGTRTITAELGSQRVSQSVTVASSATAGAGQGRETPTVTFVWPQDSAPGTMGTASTPPAAGAKTPSLVPAIVLGAGGVVALGAGVGFFAMSEATGGKATDAGRRYDNLPRKQQTAEERKVVGDLLREQDRLLTGAAIAWMGAAALGAGAIGYSLYRAGVRGGSAGKSLSARTTVQWLPAVSPQGTGVVVQGSF